MKKIIKNIDKPLFIITIILFMIGLIMVFSASNITALMKYGASPYRYFSKQLIFLVVSFIAALFIIRFKTKSYGGIAWIALIGVIVVLYALLAYGSVKNKAISWLNIGPFGIQPSEFAKLIIIIWMATYYEKNKAKLDHYTVSLFPIGMAGIVAVAIFLQPDLGTTVIFSLLAFFLFMIAPIQKEIRSRILLLLIGGIGVVVLLVLGSGKEILLERQLERFDFANPCSEEKFYNDGNQVCNGYIAINNGGLFGVGLGNSTQKYLYLPEAHTDFIFAIIMEELGLIPSLGIILLYILLLGRIIKIGKESFTDRGAMMCYGIAMFIFLHIAVNLMGIFGLMPMTGVPLPFMSYGGSFTMTLVFALTVVQRVNVENRLQYEGQQKAKKSRKK